jgi:hypothetical protein
MPQLPTDPDGLEGPGPLLVDLLRKLDPEGSYDEDGRYLGPRRPEPLRLPARRRPLDAELELDMPRTPYADD